VDNVAAAFVMTNAILAEGESRPTDACPRKPHSGIAAKVGVPIAITTRYELSLAIDQPSAFFPMNNLANNRTNKSRTISMNIAQHINPIKKTIRIVPFSSNPQLSQSHLNKTKLIDIHNRNILIKINNPINMFTMTFITLFFIYTN
jgi:hypothetical protein